MNLIAIILLAQASQPWQQPQQPAETWQQPRHERPQPRTDSPYMLDGRGRLTHQPFNESRQWPAYVEPVTPQPYSNQHGNHGQ